MTEQHFLYLLDGFKRQKLSREELLLFLDAAGESRFESLVGDQFIKDVASYKSSLSGDPAYQEMIWKSLNNKRSLPPVRPAHRVHFLRKWGWAAASVLLVLGIGAYLLIDNKKNTAPTVATVTTGEIPPGKDGAILTLADGSQVVLDSLGNGVIASQHGAEVVLKDGQLTYDLTGEIAGEMAYNTMTTPKGRQFSLLLPDGTRVWLNAASSLRYPTVFTEAERQVHLTGEAYFEVAKNTKMPFRVNVADKVEVEVLGTHFNVNAYENETAIYTTLLEGSVRVNNAAIKPGQQAQIVNAVAVSSDRQLSPAQPIKIINNADIDKVMAWKNGLFNFNGLTFEEIMRQVERWYDIQVVYENNNVPNKRLAGGMTRGVSLNGLLKYLGKMDVRYKLDGRTLIVSP